METNVNRQQIQIDGERDVQSDTSKFLWFAVGLALNKKKQRKSVQIEKRLKMNAKSGNIQK